MEKLGPTPGGVSVQVSAGLLSLTGLLHAVMAGFRKNENKAARSPKS